WREAGLRVEHIDLTALRRRACPALDGGAGEGTADRAGRPPGALPAGGVSVMAVLFADAVGYGKLTEEQVPRFVEHFLGAVAGLVARSGRVPVGRNTWGDGLYFVFEQVRDAGLFALDLC